MKTFGWLVLISASVLNANNATMPADCSFRGVPYNNTCVCDAGYASTGQVPYCDYKLKNSVEVWAKHLLGGWAGMGNIFMGRKVEGAIQAALFAAGVVTGAVSLSADPIYAARIHAWFGLTSAVFMLTWGTWYLVDFVRFGLNLMKDSKGYYPY